MPENKFTPTHEITLTDREGATRTIEVQLVDGCAYTRQEWDNDTSADWEWSAENGWTFQGRTAPQAWQQVSVREINAAEESA